MLRHFMSMRYGCCIRRLSTLGFMSWLNQMECAREVLYMKVANGYECIWVLLYIRQFVQQLSPSPLGIFFRRLAWRHLFSPFETRVYDSYLFRFSFFHLIPTKRERRKTPKFHFHIVHDLLHLFLFIIAFYMWGCFFNFHYICTAVQVKLNP